MPTQLAARIAATVLRESISTTSVRSLRAIVHFARKDILGTPLLKQRVNPVREIISQFSRRCMMILNDYVFWTLTFFLDGGWLSIFFFRSPPIFHQSFTNLPPIFRWKRKVHLHDRVHLLQHMRRGQVQRTDDPFRVQILPRWKKQSFGRFWRNKAQRISGLHRLVSFERKTKISP